MTPPRFYRSDDYAGLDCDLGTLYYGYEVTVCGECGARNCDDHEDADKAWCFTATLDGRERACIPQTALGTADMFDVVKNLIMGIGWLLSHPEEWPPVNTRRKAKGE